MLGKCAETASLCPLLAAFLGPHPPNIIAVYVCAAGCPAHAAPLPLLAQPLQRLSDLQLERRDCTFHSVVAREGHNGHHKLTWRGAEAVCLLREVQASYPPAYWWRVEKAEQVELVLWLWDLIHDSDVQLPEQLRQVQEAAFYAYSRMRHLRGGCRLPGAGAWTECVAATLAAATLAVAVQAAGAGWLMLGLVPPPCARAGSGRAPHARTVSWRQGGASSR